MAAAGGLLHHDCGMHRTTAPSASGRAQDRFERDALAHKALGVCPKHSNAKAITAANGGRNCEACGQPAEYHGGS